MSFRYMPFPKKEGGFDLAIIDEDGNKLCSVCRKIKPDMCLRSCEHWIHFKCCNSNSYRTHICELCVLIPKNNDETKDDGPVLESDHLTEDKKNEPHISIEQNLSSYSDTEFLQCVNKYRESRDHFRNIYSNHQNLTISNREKKRNKKIHQENREKYLPKIKRNLIETH